ncbi:methylated-DNA--[protein]-cysteine S-methyltransferase [Cellulomonas sp.]|uniref:methylated-DNA--[protein]-cysteine S-methyltransferase n=1 Tax=Cellulomonas sp. TaxID=40001 RepID=UPI0025867856|nr:methylated-DNA--[protein]-cysteine S-methyltransferase [Cellulomonas sp.]MCR6688404.1 methylated-DNA--[protein]-cysteine S-methyltransferase [Cellulomonas sp.]
MTQDAVTTGRVHTCVATPLGEVVVAALDGAVTHVRLPFRAAGPASVPPSVPAAPVEPVGLGERVGPADEPVLAAAADQLTAYFAGRLRAFDLPLRLTGTAFQLRVWQGLRAIPYGTTTTYGALAADLGLDPRTTSRAVGAANGANRVAIVVPCHRVVGADGTLTGFAAGVGTKRALLDLERGAAGPDDVLF